MRGRSVCAALWGCLLLFQSLAVSALDLRPAQLNISQQANGTLLLFWQSQSVITNTGCTPVFPQYKVQVSSDLTSWWDTSLLVPQRVGGLPYYIQTNFTPVPMFPVIFIRVNSSLNFRGLDMSGANFSGVDFTGIDFTGARFDGAVLTKTIFTNAILTDVQMNNATAGGALCYAAKAERLVAKDSDFSQGSWLHAVLTSAVLNSSRFTNNNMRAANMDNVQATHCSFSKVVFNSNSMRDADFTGSVFKDGTLVNVNIDHSRFGDANFDNVSIEDTHGEYTYFYSAVLTDTIIDDADFSYADFRTANFEHSQWKYTDFRYCDFRGADLDGVTDWGCDFYGADFWGPP